MQGTSSAFVAGVVAHKAHSNPIGSNERIRVGFIGLGNRGSAVLSVFREFRDVEVAALCDVYEPYLRAARAAAPGTSGAYSDYRKILDRADIDAVVIATPDHWHAVQAVAALDAKKDVYIEKPLSLRVAEGRAMVEASRRSNRVVQVGLQRRSAKYIQEAISRIHAGEIGKVTVARCFHLTNEFPVGIGVPADCDPPAELDWEMWLGPAPRVPYNPNRCLYKFRWFWDYSGGQITNMGTHYLDVIQWALQQDHPISIAAAGGKFAVEDNRETPDTMEAIWQYKDTLVTFSQHNANASLVSQRRWEIVFQGTKGTLGITPHGYEIMPEQLCEDELPVISPLSRPVAKKRADTGSAAPVTVAGTTDLSHHVRNFLDCIKSRQPANCPIEIGHRSTTASLLANIALRVGRQLEWDPVHEKIINNDDANQLLQFDHRAPWRI